MLTFSDYDVYGVLVVADKTGSPGIEIVNPRSNIGDSEGTICRGLRPELIALMKQRKYQSLFSSSPSFHATVSK